MSRTYRRKSGNRWWTRKEFGRTTWNNPDYLNAAERDGGVWCNHSVHSAIKWHTNFLRRGDERHQLQKVYLCDDDQLDEFDFVSREKWFKHLRWCYD